MKYSILSLLLFLFACQKENSKTAIDLHKEICKDLFSANNTLQTIKFKLTSDTLIIGKKGTGVWINKDLFENYSGGIITMHLKEVYTKEDVILNGLSTLTDKDELLETSGMLYINFLENKKNLVIKRNKKINIEPKSNITPNSNIYSIKNDSIFKWTLNKNDTIYTIIPDFVRNFQFGLIPGENLAGAFVKEIPLEKLRQTIIDDSLRLTKLIEDKKVTDSILFNFNDSFRYEFSVSDLGWINIDLLLKKNY